MIFFFHKSMQRYESRHGKPQVIFRLDMLNQTKGEIQAFFLNFLSHPHIVFSIYH